MKMFTSVGRFLICLSHILNRASHYLVKVVRTIEPMSFKRFELEMDPMSKGELSFFSSFRNNDDYLCKDLHI